MTDFLQRLKQRKLVQWALAYVAGAWALLQVLDLAAQNYSWPRLVMHLAFGLVALGFLLTLVLAWYHGERGVQRVTGPELLIVALLLAIGGTLLWRFTPRGTRGLNQQAAVHSLPAKAGSAVATPGGPATAASIPAKSIAVLPFENLSSDKNNAYFADGMQDLILTKLASIGDLAVISRTSTMQYGSHPQDLRTVGRQLGVATILEGSVQKAGDQVLVNVQLIDARNDHHIWANSYTRTLKNVFSVEGEVAQKIADTLKARLSPAETRRMATTLSDDPAANDLYLQGEFFAGRGGLNFDTAAMKRAITLYQRALAKVPDFVQARARLSIMESNLAWFGGGGEDTAPLFADALTQAKLALKQAPELADAHLALGLYEYWGKADYVAALKAISDALALRPNDAAALTAKAWVLRRQGKFNQSIGVFRKAVALDPRDVVLASEMGATYASVGQYAQAEQIFGHALALDPASAITKAYFAWTIVYRSGDLPRALALAQGDKPIVEMIRVYLLTLSRKYAQALSLLQAIPDSQDTFRAGNGGYLGPKALHLASLHGLRGEPAKARADYARALPQARAQYASLSGSPPINQALALTLVAQAEIGLGRTRAGLADTDKALAMGEHSNDRYNLPQLMVRCAQLYAQAGRAGKAVPLLSAALATPGIGSYYSPLMLWIDPALAPIRKSPRFQALLDKYASDKPGKASNVQVQP